jgi:hypothetical protein
MINNLSTIKNLVNFQSDDEFLHLQILKRKKENPDLGSNSYVVKSYYIRSWDYLESKIPEIINLCEFNNARACINLNKRSFELIAFHTLKKVTDQIMNKDFKSVHKAYESVCGAYCADKDKKWIIDIDWIDWPNKAEIANLVTLVQELQKQTGKEPIIEYIPTKNGTHIITRPFNLSKFRNFYPSIDVHKDNPTILFIPISTVTI